MLYPCSAVVPFRSHGTIAELAFLDRASSCLLIPSSEDPDRIVGTRPNWHVDATDSPILRGESTENILKRLRPPVAGICCMTRCFAFANMLLLRCAQHHSRDQL